MYGYDSETVLAEQTALRGRNRVAVCLVRFKTYEEVVPKVAKLLL